MATKDLLDSTTAKNNKPATTGMTNAQNANKADQKKHMPCKNSLPT